MTGVFCVLQKYDFDRSSGNHYYSQKPNIQNRNFPTRGAPLKPAYKTKFAFLSAVGVSKAINQFKANRQTLSSQKQQQNPEQQKQINDKNDEKVKKLVKATNDEKLEKAKRERKKYTKAM